MAFRTIPTLLVAIFLAGVGAHLVAQGGQQLKIIVRGGATLRTKPDLRSRAIAQLPFGARVVEQQTAASERTVILGVEDSWRKVRYGTKEGWVFGALLGADYAKPMMVVSGHLIPASWQHEPLPENSGALPPPPKNCSSLAHYLYTRHSPIGKVEGNAWSPNKPGHISRSFAGGLSYAKKWSLEGSEEQIHLPATPPGVAFQALKHCADRFRTKPVPARFPIEWCIEIIHAPATHSETFAVSAKAKGSIVKIGSAAHARCRGEPLERIEEDS